MEGTMLNLRPLAALVLAIPLAAQSLVIQPAPGVKTTETRTMPLAAGAPLRVKNVNGFVHVTGWDRNEVSFTGAFKPGSRQEQVKVVLEPKDGGLEVRGEYPKHASNGPSVDMELKVPRSALPSLETVNGGITLSAQGLQGHLEASTLNGELRMKGEGAKDVRVSKRHFEATFGNGGQALRLKTLNGDITLD
jgi:DUF4097 and DUF4098 domain-containing protein YvlB